MTVLIRTVRDTCYDKLHAALNRKAYAYVGSVGARAVLGQLNRAMLLMRGVDVRSWGA